MLQCKAIRCCGCATSTCFHMTVQLLQHDHNTCGGCTDLPLPQVQQPLPWESYPGRAAAGCRTCTHPDSHQQSTPTLGQVAIAATVARSALWLHRQPPLQHAQLTYHSGTAHQASAFWCCRLGMVAHAKSKLRKISQGI